MSASKDKKLRKQQIEAGTDKHTQAAAKEAAQRRKSTITYSVVAVVLVIFFAFIFIYNSSWPTRHTTAVEINGEKYTAAQLNYYYSSTYLTFYNNYSDYINYGMFFDPNTSLDDQEYADGQTWREYFLQTAANDMAQIQMLNDEAEAAGFTLSEEQQTAYEEELEAIRTNWENLGYSSYQQYLNMVFGKGVDDALVERELYRTHVASAYSQSIFDSYEYGASDLTDYYAEHADELDMINYAYYIVTDDAVDAGAMAEAINGGTVEDFTAYLEENVGEDTAPVSQSLAGSSLPVSYSEWLLDSARQPGDATAIATEASESSTSITYVLLFLGRDTNDYPTVNFRHILITATDADGDGAFSQEEQDAAAADAEAILAEWQSGDATEDSFAALANERSLDGGSNTNGGLYENVYKNAMVPPINDWLFEDGRQAGDTTVVSYSGANYTGTHVVYFVGASDMTYADQQADSALRNADYNAWLEEHMADYTAATSHLSLCGKNR